MKLTHFKDSCTLECSRAELSAFIAVTRPDTVNLSGILVHAKDRVVISTDGHRMLVADVGRHEDEDRDQSPPGDSVTHHSVILGPDVIHRALRLAAKKETIAITWGPDGDGKPPRISVKVGAASGTLTDVGAVATFPPWRSVIARRDDLAQRVAFNAKYVMQICKMLRRACGKYRPVEIWLGSDCIDGHKRPTIFQMFNEDIPGSRWRCALMPLRHETFREPREDDRHARDDAGLGEKTTKKPARKPAAKPKKTAKKAGRR